MRWIRRICVLAAAAVAIAVAVANDQRVVVRLMPEGLPFGDPLAVEAPLFVVILAAVLLGLVAGILLEWSRRTLAARRRPQIRAD